MTINEHWKRQDYQQVTDKKKKNLPEEEEVVVAEVLAGGIRRTEDHIQYLRHECYSLPVDRFLQI